MPIFGWREVFAWGSAVNTRRYCAAPSCRVCARISGRYSPYITRVLSTHSRGGWGGGGHTPATITHDHVVPTKTMKKNVYNLSSWWMGGWRGGGARKPLCAACSGTAAALSETKAAFDKSRYSFNGNQLVRQKQGSEDGEDEGRGHGRPAICSLRGLRVVRGGLKGGLKETAAHANRKREHRPRV